MGGVSTRTPRWRMTLDELCWRVRKKPQDLERWAQLGAFGPRWKEPRDRGKWRHINRETAQRAVIMAQLVESGMKEENASKLAEVHRLKETEDLDLMLASGVRIVIKREDLP